MFKLIYERQNMLQEHAHPAFSFLSVSWLLIGLRSLPVPLSTESYEMYPVDRRIERSLLYESNLFASSKRPWLLKSLKWTSGFCTSESSVSDGSSGRSFTSPRITFYWVQRPGAALPGALWPLPSISRCIVLKPASERSSWLFLDARSTLLSPSIFYGISSLEVAPPFEVKI